MPAAALPYTTPLTSDVWSPAACAVVVVVVVVLAAAAAVVVEMLLQVFLLTIMSHGGVREGLHGQRVTIRQIYEQT